MVFNPASWVNHSVKALIAERERLPLKYNEIERERWRRMATDPRMQGVFSSKYLARRLTERGWCIWFDHACGVEAEALKHERERLKKYASLMVKFDEYLDGASSVLNQIKEMDIGEKNLPRVMFDPFLLIQKTVDDAYKSGNGKLQFLFDNNVKEKLDKLSYLGSKYMPSVPQMLTTLSEHVSFAASNLQNGQIESSCSITVAALSSRQHAPVPEYVRYFDRAMLDYEIDTGGPNFLVPPQAMALQTVVALDLNDVDKRQIISVRGAVGSQS